MQRAFLVGLVAVAGFLALSTAVQAGGPDPADYPLRVHVLKSTSQSRHSRESKSFSDTPDYIDGQGVADLFEGGEPQGFEFSYSCIGGCRPQPATGPTPRVGRRSRRLWRFCSHSPASHGTWSPAACVRSCGRGWSSTSRMGS